MLALALATAAALAAGRPVPTPTPIPALVSLPPSSVNPSCNRGGGGTDSRDPNLESSIPGDVVAAVPVTAPAVGGNRDRHGCLLTAGYVWCPGASQCVRLWETPCPELDETDETDEPAPEHSVVPEPTATSEATAESWAVPAAVMFAATAVAVAGLVVVARRFRAANTEKRVKTVVLNRGSSATTTVTNKPRIAWPVTKTARDVQV